jgi:pimeloyl-ACP methyl ester carboxylesterase
MATTTDTPRTAAPHWTAIDWRPHVHDVQVAGHTVRYCDYGSGPVLLLLHGLGCCWQWWLENLPALGAERRVIAVDLPGFGYSDPLEPPAEMAEQARVVHELCRQLELEEITVAGHSMGGLVALALTTAHPGLVRRVILVNAGGVPMTEARLSAVIGVIRLAHKLLSRSGIRRAAARTPAGLSRGDEQPARAVPAARRRGRSADGRARVHRRRDRRRPGRARHRAGGSALSGAAGVGRPRSDRHRGQRPRDGATAPRPRLVLIHGAGHTPMLERPDEFNRHVLAFTAEEGS